MNNIERRDKELAYIADESVIAEMKKCRKLLHTLNNTEFDNLEEISKIAASLLGKSENAFINPPF